MSPTTAVRKSRREHSDIIRRSRTDFVFYAPAGHASIEVQRSDYFKARAARTARVASYALRLLGFDRDEAEDAADDGKGGSALEIVQRAVEKKTAAERRRAK